MFFELLVHYIRPLSSEELIYLFINNSIIAHQQVRAFWEADNPYPVCSAIDNQPIGDEPLSPQCQGCAESIIGNGKCKPKIRLWMLVEKEGEVNSYIMNLSPTSIRSFQTHLLKLKRSNLPLVVVKTVIELEDTKRSRFRWAICNFNISGVVSKDILGQAKQYREELKKLMGMVTETDFDEKGDKRYLNN